MRVAFRADASSKIGTGHIARCLTLADALRSVGAETQFICRHLPEPMAESMRASGHALSVLPHGATVADGAPYADWLETSQEEDARATAALAEGAWDWLVVDHYALDAKWEIALQPAAYRILAIDDLANRPHVCDTLLDQNLQPEGVDRYEGLISKGGRALIGPRYALLRPEFSAATLRDGEAPLRRINIFFGGFDAAGMTLRAIDELAPFLATEVSADVVVGMGNPQLIAIRRRCEELGATLHVQSNRMAALFAGADLGLGAGGATSWERCRMGLPTVIVSVADNQRSGCAALADRGAAICLGDAENLQPGRLGEVVAALAADAPARAAMAQRGQALVDGRGTERILLHMMREKIMLRPAMEEDARRAWLWRNHPQTRSFSGESAELAWDAHADWWRASLQSAQRDLLLVSCVGIDIGVLRFDHSGDAATVSIYLDPDLNGLGLGSAALRAANDWVARHRRATTLSARVLQNNEQSQRSFAAAGYRQTGAEKWVRSVKDGKTES